MKLNDPKLESLLLLWREKRASRLMPARADITVQALKPWLGYLALIDVRSQPHIFRVCGTKLHSRFHGEMTRREVSGLEHPAARSLQAAIAQVCETSTPICTRHTDRTESCIKTFNELYLPLGDDGSTADTILFASYADPRSPTLDVGARGAITGIFSQWM